jgi:CRP/FNR family transcriptional regulator, cyclic AMP receptor protein
MTIWTDRNKRELLSKHFLLRDIDAHTLDRILQYSVTKKLPADSVIFQEGDPGDCLYGILCGQVRIFNMGPKRREILLNILQAGNLFGEIALIDDRPRTASASTVTNCELLTIHRHHFIPLLKSDPQLAIHLLTLLCDRVRWTSAIIEDAAFLNLRGRLAKRLLALAHTHGETLPGDQGIRIKLRLSQHQLGAMVGGSREGVNKQIMAWRNDGIVDFRNGLLILRRPDWLEAIVG